jgi:hypothetical protein
VLTAMSTSWVIKLPLDENAGGAVLVHISPGEGDALDLDLLATDGESAFKGKGELSSGGRMHATNVRE